MNEYRTHYCNELRISDVGEEVRLAGWVQTIRDLGSMMFVDLRDHYGITQLAIEDEANLELMRKVTTESTISITGKVCERSNKNPNMITGDIEVIPTAIRVTGKAKNVLPFEINIDQDVREDLRLEYRFLDLRNEKIHKNIVYRAKIMKTIREIMDGMNFVEIQTPILTSSSPEGARDFLVPSRLHPGEFYALPQAPQQFKQLLMMSGFDRYYQIAPCFRDEDPRADRSPGEFYQLDLEMSFATQDDVLAAVENVVLNTFRKHSTWQVSPDGLERIPYREAMKKYGIDKPDLRNPLILQDVTDMFVGTEFKAFEDKHIIAIVVPGAGQETRKFFDNMGEFAVTECGAKGLAYVKVEENGTISGGIAKFFTEIMTEELLKVYAKPGDAVFFIADEVVEKAQKMAGLIRIELGKRLDLLEKNVYKFCWIVDFPMYEKDDEGKVEFNHNPFSMPQGGLEALNTKDPLDIYAYQYDMVCNGYELASGAVRNHDIEIMEKAFAIAGYTKEHVEAKFPALYNAFQYGAPPHAGCAPGLDRIVMLLANENSIREVIAFPKNSKARDLLMGAPSPVFENQLNDVHIKLDIKDKEKEEKKEE
ncbi:MAG: aspartate--tRNA ligase [Clostridia bacterium]|nr:aspartate--tRNA ligase [Clostridia bacterium]